MKSRISQLLALTLSAFLLIGISCDSNKESTTDNQNMNEEVTQDLTKAKKEMTLSVNEAISDIDDKIAILEIEMENASDDVKDKLQTTKESLEDERATLQDMAQDIAEASANTWDDVKNESRIIINSSKEKMNSITADVKDLFSKESD